MTDKHPDAGVEAAIKVVEGHRKLFEGDSKREALCTSILSCLRALPAQQPDVSELVEALEASDYLIKSVIEQARDMQTAIAFNEAHKRNRAALQSQQKAEEY